MFITDIFYALCDAFTLSETQKVEARNNLIYNPICGDEFILPCFYEENESTKTKNKSNEKRD